MPASARPHATAPDAYPYLSECVKLPRRVRQLVTWQRSPLCGCWLHGGCAAPLSLAMTDAPIPMMQSTVRAALASARAQSSMEPVQLIASDGSVIIIDRKAALISGTIKAMLAGPGARRARARLFSA